MFTGIVEGTGTIESRKPRAVGASVSISSGSMLDGLRQGDSVAVNGVCLTITEVAAGMFRCDLSPETILRTTLGSLKEGTLVNLERPLSVGARLGGHFVQGHVDGVGRLRSSTPGGDGAELVFEYPPEIGRYLARKGSVAVDGISLTISSLQERTFSVAVIPYTMRVTNLGRLAHGTAVNIEADIIAKYVERILQAAPAAERVPGLTATYLKEQGF